MADKSERKTDIMELIKSFIVVLVPVLTVVVTATFNYTEYLRKSSDENFRSLVKELSSEDVKKRLAAATGIGTFIKKEGRYSEEAADILINRMSIELDYNVLNAVVGSLAKTETIDKRLYEKVIKDLLAINRNYVIQSDPLKKWRNEAEDAFKVTEKEISDMAREVPKSKGNEEALVLLVKDELPKRHETFYERDKSYIELEMHRQAITDAFSILLRKIQTEKYNPPVELNFYQNSLSFAIMADMNLNGSSIYDTFFSNTDLTNSSFVACRIKASLFANAGLKGVLFLGTEFDDVFFTGADLTGADFRGANGLDPKNFFKAKNISRAMFDDKEFAKKAEDVKVDDFIRYVYDSNLTRLRKDQLVQFFYDTL